jgi:hypothetical protein
MALIPTEGNPNKVLVANDFTSQGDLKTAEDTTALVVGCAVIDEAFIQSKQWALLWRDSDLLFQAPRPLTVFENSYTLEPNVQRFTVAKVVNSVVPKLYAGIFFEDPPMVLRPRPGTSQKTVDEKTTVMSVMLDECNFKREVKWGLEQFCFLGTGIWKWGIKRVTKKIPRRITNSVKTSDSAGGSETIHSDAPPTIKWTERTCYIPFFESRPLGNVLIDATLDVGDIREAKHVIDRRFLDFYALKDLKDANVDENGKPLPGWTWGAYWSDDKLKELWAPPMEASMTPSTLRTDQTNTTVGVVHHAQEKTIISSNDPLAQELEVLEYVDKKRKIIVVNRKITIYSAENEFKKINFLSANWWNRPKAFYGMGIGLTVGQNQRVDQGTINSILKILSFGVNPVYLRARDSNSPTQMIRTSIGKIVSVDGEVDKAYKLLEQPKVPAETWAALQNSEANTESTTGADQALVQGSSAGPRNGMGRSATGANNLAQASATRLDGPLDAFLDQVFLPWLYILDELIFTYLSDKEIKDILGDELGKDYLASFDQDVDPADPNKTIKVDGMQEYHNGKVTFEVLAGASLSAKKTMAQSLVLLEQFLANPQFLEFLADQGYYVDQLTLLDMVMMASDWKDRRDLIKPLTPQMEARRQQKLQQQQQGPLQTQMQLNDQKAQLKSQQADEDTQGRIKRDLMRFAVESSARSEETEGTPGGVGFGDVA